jgi:hypothetical protein
LEVVENGDLRIALDVVDVRAILRVDGKVGGQVLLERGVAQNRAVREGQLARRIEMGAAASPSGGFRQG